MPQPRQVQCVDESGAPIGLMDVIAAHSGAGTLHLACSAVVFGPGGTVLVQRRADHKSTFGGRWSNTCCTHPLPGESPLAAAERRLTEELGITVPLEPAGSFRYRAVDPDTAMVEHELDHVLIGRVGQRPHPTPDPHEVADTAWWTLDDLQQRLADDQHTEPAGLTPWFDLVLRIAVSAIDA